MFVTCKGRCRPAKERGRIPSVSVTAMYRTHSPSQRRSPETSRKKEAMTDDRQKSEHMDDILEIENREWRESLEYVHRHQGPQRVVELLRRLQTHAQEKGVRFPYTANTPYINTIPVERQPVFPGRRDIERRIKSIIRWNAMAMVVRANKQSDGIGGHISTYASAATLLEVGFNHFFHARIPEHPGDSVYFQGHAAPGVYARAFLEGRFDEQHLKNFRRELQPGGGFVFQQVHNILADVAPENVIAMFDAAYDG
jgi:pyruvate dehydrogenase E1 component